MSELPKDLKEVDLFRDTPVRYLGYANEVGEAFGVLYPKYVRPSYVVAFGYVGCDTINNVYKSYKLNQPTNEIVRKGFDVLIWQTLASVLIPGKLIHFVTHQSSHIIETYPSIHKNIPLRIRPWSPTIIGLSTIPFIIHPIDNAVDWFMDSTIRSVWK